MVVSTLLTLAGMLGGAGYGYGQAQKRSRDAYLTFEGAEDMLDYTLARNEAQKAIVEGNLTVAALSNNARSKAAAIDEYQANSAEAAGLGDSGFASGTPFYKIATDIRERRSALLEQAKMQELQFDAQTKEARATLLGGVIAEKQARSQLMAAGAEAAYAESTFAMLMGAGTGAVSGGSMANELMTLGVQTKLVDNDFLGTDLFSGLFQSSFDKATGVGTGPAYNQSVPKATLAPLDFSYVPSVPSPAGRSDYQFTSQVLSPSMSSFEGISFPNYFAQQQKTYSDSWGERKVPQWGLFL